MEIKFLVQLVPVSPCFLRVTPCEERASDLFVLIFKAVGFDEVPPSHLFSRENRTANVHTLDPRKIPDKVQLMKEPRNKGLAFLKSLLNCFQSCDGQKYVTYKSVFSLSDFF